MARRTETITQTTINSVLRSLSKDRPEFEVGDERTRGLCIRVRKTSAVWALRCRIGAKQTVVTIGPVQALQDVEFVRKLAELGKARAKAGENPVKLFRSAIEAQSPEHAEALERAASGKEWTWDEMVEHYLAYKWDERRKRTYQSYKSALHHKCIDSLKGKLLSQISQDDIRVVRDALVRHGKFRQMQSCVQQLKYSLEWACDEKDSGIRINPAAFVKAKARKSLKPKDALADLAEDTKQQNAAARMMTPEEVGLLMWEIDTEPNVAMRQIIIMSLLTGQRRLTISSAIKDYITHDQKFGLLWSIHPGLIKTQREHALPLVGFAADAYERALLLTTPQLPWLFPQQKKRFATDKGDNHISEGSANRVLRRLQKPGRLLHTERKFSPHSFRRTFITMMSEAGFAESQIELVTHDAEGRKSVLAQHYNASKKMPAKLELLTAWNEVVAKLKAENKPKDAISESQR